MTPVVQLQAVSLRISDKWIYRDLSLAVRGDGCTVLLGPSGTGKSTLLRLLTGQIQRHPLARVTGRVEVKGLNTGQPDLAGRPPAMVEQKAGLLVSDVWASMVIDWPRRRALTQAEQKLELAKILAEWGQSDLIAHWSDTVVGLSQSIQMRVAIVRVALSGAPLLLIDEPTANLRGDSAEPILELIQVLKRQVPVLVVTHNLEHARWLADDILLVASGVLQEQTPAPAFFEAPRSVAGQAFLRSGSCPEEPIQAPAAAEPDALVAAAPADAQAAAGTAPLPAQTAPAVAAPANPQPVGQLVVPGRAATPAAPAEAPVIDSIDAWIQRALQAQHSAPAAALPAPTRHAGAESSLPAAARTLTAPGAAPGAAHRSVQAGDAQIGALQRPSIPPAPPAREPGPRGRGPRGFTWMLEGKLAGTPWPGIVSDMDEDLSALRGAGITHLFSLTESPFPAQAAAAWGLSCSAYPMVDMTAPDLDQAETICQWLYELINSGHAVAVHCKAGLGRTGTVLGMYWIWSQNSAVSHQNAIQWVRSKNMGMIQSVAQENFLLHFSSTVGEMRPSSMHLIS